MTPITAPPQSPAERLGGQSANAAAATFHVDGRPSAELAECCCPDFCERDHANE